MLLFYVFLLAGVLATVLNLELYGTGGITYFACAYYLSAYIFCETAADYGCFCTNENARASMVGCFESFKSSTTAAENYMINYCETWYGDDLTMDDFELSYEYYLKNATDPTVANPDFDSTVDVVTSPILVDYTTAKLYRDAYVAFLGNYDHSIFYGLGAIGYWFLMCILAAIANWSIILFPGLRTFFNGKISKAWRRYVTMPALWTRKRLTQQDFLGGLLSFLVPSRLESVLLFFYFWLIFAMLVVEIYYVPNDPLFSSKREALTRYIADRLALVATMTIPLLILFGGRNNFLQWFTRWRFSTFITYHRWIARLMVAMSFAHSVAFTAEMVIEQDYALEMKETYVIWGVVAIVCGALICIQGLLYLRRSYYETFLVIHIILAAFFVIGLWYHISVLDYPQLVYPVFAIWGFDRLVRIVRILWFGFPRAKVELIAGDAIKVSVPKPRSWRSIPGGHAWIHFVLGWYFWQSHPFTFIELESESESHVVFYCKMKNGVTLSLSKKLANIPGRTLSIRVAIEGPYGESSPVHRHSSVTYVAGGNGIPGIFAEAFDLAKDAAKRSTNSQKIKLVWIMREVKSLGWFYNELKLLQNLPVETILYISRPENKEGAQTLHELLQQDMGFEKLSGSDNSEKSKDSVEAEREEVLKKNEFGTSDILVALKKTLPHITVHEGRPDLNKIVLSDIEKSAGSSAFVTCGHPAMVDDLRLNVLRAMDTTSKRVDFYDQLQVWA